MTKKYLNNIRVRSNYTKSTGPATATFSKAYRLILSPAATALLGGLSEVTVAYDDEGEQPIIYLSNEKIENVKPYTLTPIYGNSGVIVAMAGLRQEVGYDQAARFIGSYTAELVTDTTPSILDWTTRLVLTKTGQAELPEHLEPDTEGETEGLEAVTGAG